MHYKETYLPCKSTNRSIVDFGWGHEVWLCVTAQLFYVPPLLQCPSSAATYPYPLLAMDSPFPADSDMYTDWKIFIQHCSSWNQHFLLLVASTLAFLFVHSSSLQWLSEWTCKCLIWLRALHQQYTSYMCHVYTGTLAVCNLNCLIQL